MPRMQRNGVHVLNKAGVYKKFNDVDSPNAISWKWSNHTSDPDARVAKPKRVKMTAEQKAQRAEEKKMERDKHEIMLYNKIEHAFGTAFDGCDPIDFLHPVMNRYGLEMKDIDRIWKKWGHNGKKGFYASLMEAWDDHQGDRIHDAKNGHIDDNSQFYRVVDGEIVPERNPWKPM